MSFFTFSDRLSSELIRYEGDAEDGHRADGVGSVSTLKMYHIESKLFIQARDKQIQPSGYRYVIKSTTTQNE